MSKAKPSGFIAIDTETTGGDFAKGDRPFYVSTCDDNGKIVSWEFKVSPTRSVTVPPTFCSEFLKTVGNKTPVFHNGPFDLRALYYLFNDVADQQLLENTHTDPKCRQWLSFLLKSDAVWKKTGQSSAFNYFRYHDTLLLSHVYRNIGSHGLKDLCLEYLDITDDDESDLLTAIKQARTVAKSLGWQITPGDDRDQTQGNWLKQDSWLPHNLWLHQRAKLPTWKNVLSIYANRDAERTMSLFLFLREVVQQDGLWDVYHCHLQASPVITQMMLRGVSINHRSMCSEWDRYQTMCDEAEVKIREAAGNPQLNLNSPKQLCALLFEELGITPLRFTKGGAPSLDKDTVPKLHDSLADLPLPPEKIERADTILSNILEYRRAEKVISYFEQYFSAMSSYNKGHFRVHGNLNQTGTQTTRLSHSRPNLGNVGKGKEWEGVDDEGNLVKESDYKTRKAFGPAPGRIWFCLDYKQLQLGIFAYRAGETELIEGFRKGKDAHDAVARRLYGIEPKDKPTAIQRRDAKAVNFGYIFGKSERKLDLIQPGLGKLVQTMFPHASGYLGGTKRKLGSQAYETGRPHVFTKDGYRLFVPPNDQGNDRPYAGVCYEVQGDEGTLVKRAMVLTHNYLEEEFDGNWDTVNNLPVAFLCLQVHDELIFDFQDWRAFDKTSKKTNKKQNDKYRPYIARIKTLMEEAGASLGYDTPVSVSVVTDTWDNPLELDW